MNSYLTLIDKKQHSNNNNALQHDQFEENTALHLQRVLPPAYAINRENKITVNQEKYNDFLSQVLNPEHLSFQDSVIPFMQLMEKIRLAVQSNLGLSAIQRDKHETNHAIWIKRGKPNFPSLEKPESILFDTHSLEDTFGKKVAHAMIIQHDLNDDAGFSILFHTKFRHFSLYIDETGKVHSSLKLNWSEIYEDLSPEIIGEQQPLRSFTPWQRHSESNFFNGRSTDKILSYFGKAYPEIFKYDEKSYYQDSKSEYIELNKDNLNKFETNAVNIYLTLDDTLITPPHRPQFDQEKIQPILAVIRRRSPLLGNIIQLAPAVYENNKLHLIFHGHQDSTEILKVLSCDFDYSAVYPWTLKEKITLQTKQSSTKSVWQNLHLLKHHENRSLINQTSSAPMVRGSDPVMRKYWVGSFDIPTVYTEMITIADIFNIEKNDLLSPKERLEQFYYSDSATSSFRRLMLTEYELQQAKNVAIQIVLPHETPHANFFWGKDGENLARTSKIAAALFLEMIPKEYQHKLRFAVNMCCPAVSIEKMGAGFGLRNKPEYIEYITKAIKEQYPELSVELKALMLSNADTCISKQNGDFQEAKSKRIEKLDTLNISFEHNQALSEKVSETGISRLVWQGKSRNQEIYDLKKTLEISHSSKVSDKFNFSYSGMIAALKDQDLLRLGYEKIGHPHQSVEGVLNHLKNLYKEKCPEKFEVMLGRVLLGSSWLLLGRYASDQEILLMTLLQSLLLREFSIGAGECGIDIMQIQLAYNLRHLVNEELRNDLMSTIFETRSAISMVNCLYGKYLLQHDGHDMDATSTLRPFIIQLKTAIDSASGSQCNVYTEREECILNLQSNRFKNYK